MTNKKVKKEDKDNHLVDALTKAYSARARLFHSGVKASKIDLLIAEIDEIDNSKLDWNLDDLDITLTAKEKVENAGGCLHQVFAHPNVIINRPHLIGYYRNIVTISKKGIAQILFATNGYESGRKKEIEVDDAIRVCRTFNKILSNVIDNISEYTVELSRQAILAEIGTELQGSWANTVGRGAARAVEDIFREYLSNSGIGDSSGIGKFKLKNGWNIYFGSEPDVAFFDSKGIKRIAIEIKGSLDVAGAQTRYGEAKKSFAKQLLDNPRCHTVYLASCFTDAVIEQIKIDGQVREWFNLTAILYDEQERARFLSRIFHIVDTPD